MASGYGVNVSDWALIAVIGLGAFVAYKVVGKPLSDTANAVSEPIIAASELATNVIQAPENYWNYWFTLGEDAGKSVRGWFG